MASVLKIRSKPARGGARFQPDLARGMRAVSVRAKSFDPATKRFEFVLASETPCRTYRIDKHWNLVEVDEVLPMSALRETVRKNGWALLDSHQSWSVRDVLGRITALRIEGTELVGSAFLSDRDDVAGIAQDLASGVLCEFSVGFDVHDEGTVRERKGDVPLVTVGSWSVREGSLVPLPADATAQMRMSARSLSQSRARTIPGGARSTQHGANGMTPEELKNLLETSFRSVTDTLVGALTVGGDAEPTDDLDAEADLAAEEARAAVLAKRGQKPNGSPVTNERSAQDKATVATLRAACKKRGLEAEFNAIDASGGTIAEMRQVLVAGLRTNPAEIEGSSTPGAGAKRGKLIGFGETSRGKAAK